MTSKVSGETLNVSTEIKMNEERRQIISSISYQGQSQTQTKVPLQLIIPASWKQTLFLSKNVAVIATTTPTSDVSVIT